MPAGVLLFCLGICVAHAAYADSLVVVDHVIDGDTVILAGGERVRLIGINAPERENRGAPAQPFSLEARLALAQLVEKRRVRIAVGVQPRDRYGRTLAYLSLPDGGDVQRELLRRGYAMAVAVPPNLRHLEAYATAESEARRAGRGIWRDPNVALWRVDERGPPGKGFHRIAGRVTSVSRSARDVRIGVADRDGDGLRLLISHSIWQAFWHGLDAQEWIGETVTARGWVWSYRGRKQLRIRHSFMLRLGAGQP